MMENYKKIITILLICMLIPVLKAQDLELDVQFLPTGEFKYATWTDPNIDLWWITITNSGEATNYYMEFEFLFDDDRKIEGITIDHSISSDDSKVFYNKDFIGEVNVNANFKTYDEDEDYINDVEDLGRLPQGKYEISVRVFDIDDNILDEASALHTHTLVEKIS